MTLDFLHDLEPGNEQCVVDLSARFWDLAGSDLPNGYAMIEMAEILQEIAEASKSLPTMIVRRLRPEPVDFEILGVAYLAENFWMSSYLKFRDLEAPYRPPSYSSERDEMDGGQTSMLELRDAGEAGRGLYAREKISKGDILFVSSGQRKISCSPYESRELLEEVQDGKRRFSLKTRNPDQLWPNAICIGAENLEQMAGLRIADPRVRANLWLDPSASCPLRFLNHSCDPNLIRAPDALTFAAMRDIGANEQVTCDYSTLEVNPDWQMECKCGASNCRKVIGGIQSLPDEWLQCYDGELPAFMMDLFKESHPELGLNVYQTIRLVRGRLRC